jgi:hypothetical protein
MHGRQFLALPNAMTVFRNRLEGDFQAFLVMASAPSSADFPGFGRKRTRLRSRAGITRLALARGVGDTVLLLLGRVLLTKDASEDDQPDQ